MPQTPAKDDGGVTKKVNAAKKALDTAWKSNVSGRRPAAPEPKVVDATVNMPERKPASPYTGMLHMQVADSVHGVEERNRQAEGIEKMHDGGEVKEDGPKNLQKGEIVLPKDKDKAEKMAMEKLGKKAKGVMASAMDEVDEEKDEPKAEEKHETKKEEKSEAHKPAKKTEKKEEAKSEKKPAGKKHVGFHGYSHKGGHVVHHMYDDGSSETQNFTLGDHAGVGANIADVLGSQAPEGAAGGEGGGQGGASPEPEPAPAQAKL